MIRRVWFIARLTLTEAFRQRFLTVIVVLGIAMIAGARAMGTFDFGSSELKFTADLVFGAITLFGTILAVAMTAQLFFAELESRTALTLLARPVRRAEFLVGKLFGVLLALFAFVALITVILIVILVWRGGVLGSSESTQTPRLSAVGLVGFVLALKLALTAAITLFFCSFSRSQLFGVVVAFLAVLICHLQYLAQDVWREGEPWWVRGVAWIFAIGLPNFQVYSLGDAAADGQVIPLATVALVIIYTAFYSLVFQVLAWVCFEKREI
jgi:ABC-2 type transport system permease protein